MRSYQGLLVHAFGRLAAAMLMLALNPLIRIKCMLLFSYLSLSEIRFQVDP